MVDALDPMNERELLLKVLVEKGYELACGAEAFIEPIFGTKQGDSVMRIGVEN